MDDRGPAARMRTGSIRVLAAYWAVIGVLAMVSGVSAQGWWILVGAAVLIAGSALLWWVGGRPAPAGPGPADAASRRPDLRPLVPLLIMFAGLAVVVLGIQASAGW